MRRRSWGSVEEVITKRLANSASHCFLSVVATKLPGHVARYIECDWPEIDSYPTQYDSRVRWGERDVLRLPTFKAWRKERELGQLRALHRDFGMQRGAFQTKGKYSSTASGVPASAAPALPATQPPRCQPTVIDTHAAVTVTATASSDVNETEPEAL
jgi:hypothetical protein